MFMERNCKFCGTTFTPQTANQQYCCQNCRKIADKERKKEKSKSYKIKQKRLNPFGKVHTIDDIVGICEKVRWQAGKIVDYGFVSYLSECGKLDTLGVNL